MDGLQRKGTVPKTASGILQGDLFTGEWQDKPPARGDGSHVRLKPLDGEKPAVAGMASFAGGGPAGRYCKDCSHFGEVAVQRTPDDIELNRAGCAIYARRVGHAAPTRRINIRFCAACQYFEPTADTVRRFIVDHTGAVHRVEKFPADLRGWRLQDTVSAGPMEEP